MRWILPACCRASNSGRISSSIPTWRAGSSRNSKPTPDDAVVEVGPGTGALSTHLVGKVRRLILIEFDARLAAASEGTVSATNRPSKSITPTPRNSTAGRLFKHRPGEISRQSPLLVRRCDHEKSVRPPEPIFARGRDVAKGSHRPPRRQWPVRMTTASCPCERRRTGKSKRCAPSRRKRFTRGRRSIPPSPSCARGRRACRHYDHRLFDEMIRRGFAQRRKQLKKQLPDGADWDDGRERDSAFPPPSAAEELGLAQWIDLDARVSTPHPLKDVPQNQEEVFDVVDDRRPSHRHRHPRRSARAAACSTARCMSSFSTSVATCCCRSAPLSRTSARACGTQAFPVILTPAKPTTRRLLENCRRKWESPPRSPRRKSPASPRARKPAGNTSACIKTTFDGSPRYPVRRSRSGGVVSVWMKSPRGSTRGAGGFRAGLPAMLASILSIHSDPWTIPMLEIVITFGSLRFMPHWAPRRLSGPLRRSSPTASSPTHPHETGLPTPKACS